METLGLLWEALVRGVRDKVKQYLRMVAKKTAMATMGLASLVMGFIYLTLGLIKAVAIYMPEWTALGLVGAFLVGAGYIAIKAATS